nr:hypothetical protein [Tanacetum cinerariifolium]
MATLKFYDTHNMIAYLNKTEGSKGFHQIVDFFNSSHIKFALTKNPTIYTSLILQFWQTAVANTFDTGEIQITAIIYGNIKLISEVAIRRHLKLEDSDGISTLPNTKIFEQLALMGVPTSPSRVPTSPHDSPLQGGHIPGSDEGSLTPNELTVLCTTLSNKGRMIEDIDQDTRVILVTPTKVSSQKDQLEDQLGVLSAAKILADATRVHTYSRRRAVSTSRDGVSTASRIISTAEETVSTAGVSMPVSTAEEREKYSKDDRTKMLVDLINHRNKFFAQQRAEAKRNKPMTQAHKALIFTMRRIQDFVPMEKEGDKEVSKIAGAGGLKRDADEELDQGSTKKQKTDEASGSVQEQPVEEEKELSQEDLQQLMIIAPEQGMNVDALQVKYPIIDWEIYTEDSRKY